jgi:TPP-dependent pyruvate/acetoin dehydrogenase alpha subunit
MRHEEASGTKYVPQELMDMWAIKDPVENSRNYLAENRKFLLMSLMKLYIRN